MDEHKYFRNDPKKTRERHNCCVPQCSDVKTNLNHLHQVPGDVGLRKKWAFAIKTGKKLTSSMRVCSKHFREDDYCLTHEKATKPRLKKGAVPSQHLPLRPHDRVVSSPMKLKKKARADRAKKRTLWNQSPSEKGNSDSNAASKQSGDLGDCACPSASNVGEEGESEWQDLPHINDEEVTKLVDCGIQVDSENSPIVTSILSSDKKLFSTTGLHSIELLDSITKCCNIIAAESPLKPFLLCTRDRILLTMMKIKLAISFSALAALFDLTVQTCSNYFYDMVTILSKVLKCMIFWPGKELVLKNMPRCFKKFRCTRAILDAYEVPVEKPKCIRCRIRLYSHYKKNFTAKIMMICTPSGLITRCCACFGGRASDKVVTAATGVYNLCDPGDGLMVDKGFNIDEECHNNLITLIRPPFLRSKTRKFSKAESVESAKIARARVHVERVIQRVREYHILKHKVPWNICPYLDHIVVIVSALVNLGYPILSSEKF